MKLMLKVVVLAILVVSFVLPQLAWSQVYFVCRKYNPTKNCYICTNYSSTSSEEDAQARCGSKGMDEAHYFPSVGAAFAWKVSHCTCLEERGAP